MPNIINNNGAITTTIIIVVLLNASVLHEVRRSMAEELRNSLRNYSIAGQWQIGRMSYERNWIDTLILSENYVNDTYR